MNDDLISRSELKKSLNFVYDCDYIGSKSKEGIASDIIETIDKAPTVLHDNYSMGYQDGVKKVLSERTYGEWIPVSERLPNESNGRVLITTREGKVTTGKHSEFSGNWYIGDMAQLANRSPVAWMPLPEPYKEDDAENVNSSNSI